MSDLGKAAPLNLRLFIENAEVPVIGALVTGNEGSPATAQIEMVPANSGLNLVARSLVLLFALDPDADPEQAAESSLSTGGDRARLEGYILLFSGELFSIYYSKTGYGTRSLTLQCLDCSNVWDTSYLYTLQYSANAQEGVVAGSQQNFLATNLNGNPLDDILSSPEQVIRQIVRRQQALSKALSSSKGLLGGVLGILELIGGVQGKFVGVTAWHTIEEARLRLIDQVFADSGDTSSALFDLTAFEDWLLNKVGSTGTVVSFREIVDLICRYIFYTVAPNPVAVYRPGQRNPPTWPPEVLAAILSSGSQGSGLDPEFQPYADEVFANLKDDKGWDGKGKALAMVTSTRRPLEKQTAKTKAMVAAGQVDPGCPHLYGFAEDIAPAGSIPFGYLFAGTPSETSTSLHMRLKYWAAQYTSVDDLYNAVHGGVRLFKPEEVALAKWMVEFFRDFGKAVADVDPGGILEWGGQPSVQWGGPDPFFALNGMGTDPVHVQLRGWVSVAKSKGVNPNTSASSLAGLYSGMEDRELLRTQFFHPDIWCAPPPACNLIFPEEVTSLTFSRDMMRETTRLQLSTFDSLMGDDVVLNQVYFAPKIENVRSLASGGLGTAAKAFIYPHEKFSGIIPKMERISDLSFYSRLSSDQQIPPADVSSADKFRDEVANMGSEASEQLGKWAARTAAFTYLSHRYAARQLTVGMKFTPRLILGCPALVVDRCAPESTPLAERSSSEFTPNHFLGMLRSYTHAVNQSGGTTSASLSHVRLHKSGMDDLFSTAVYGKQELLSVQVTSTNDVTTTIVVGPGMDDAQFAWAVLLKKKISEGNFDPNNPQGLLGPAGKVINTQVGMTVVLNPTVGPDGKPADANTTAGTSKSGSSDMFPFTSVTVCERGLVTYLPLEEAIRPPWVSDEYSNAKIGQLYQKLFGCPSILELDSTLAPRTINGAKFSSVCVEDAVEALVDKYTQVSDGGYLSNGWIGRVTRRSYATLGQVLGYTDEKGRFHKGFYYDSCGDKTNLDGEMFSWMKDKKVAPSTQLNPTELNTIDPQLDPRRERYRRATAYRDELMQSPALRG